MSAFTYILLCSENKYYVGSTTNLELRLKEHFAESDALYGSRFTKGHKPIKLVYKEEYPTIAEAFKRERQLHGWSHAKKEALIKGDFEALRLLSKSMQSSRLVSLSNQEPTQTTSFEQLVELMVKHRIYPELSRRMAKVAADNAAADVRKMNLAEYLEKGIVK